ncbi:MAG: 4-(cytidine 5'-diphospho)-2-C-methyl-D-erythritol kinase [Cephaloticoccus sp.]|nr:4-(cytidine 5'-diphospho)-2-C-methyl-D-erythritol kinase [Cephaloticoccus sp.]MCF7760729.1 4-(cytidine 5'-diphospho)-2-C-methyl-D-erythritol kinase [Cephaloticoccus sp.]
MSTLRLFSPAKINLFLAITGRRQDGFHDLLSLAAPLDFGDTLEVEPADRISLCCDDPKLPVDESNLVLKAAVAFQVRTGWKGGAEFRLRKRIPFGAGLGGGSSNAVATLRALNELAGELLDPPALREVAASLGADCSLFVENSPVIMRGRGDMVERLTEAEHRRIRGKRVLVFKPGFGVLTSWAYGQMVANTGNYLNAEAAENQLNQWRNGDHCSLESLTFNNMEPVVYAKYPALPAMHEILRRRFGLKPRMSGSGSASFALLEDNMPTEDIVAWIYEAWGRTAFVISSTLV